MNTLSKQLPATIPTTAPGTGQSQSETATPSVAGRAVAAPPVKLGMRLVAPYAVRLAMRSLGYAMRHWRHNHRSRRALGQLSQEALKDIGLTEADRYREQRKWFWQD